MTRAYHCGHCGAVGHGRNTCPTRPDPKQGRLRASRDVVAAALAESNGNHQLAAVALRVTRQRVGQLVAEHGLEGLVAALKFAASPTPDERKRRIDTTAKENAAARRRRWLAEGRCPVGGCERTDDHKVCPKHRAAAAASNKKRYDRRVAEGLCTRCPSAAVPGKAHCAACLDVCAAYNRSRP